MKKFAGWRIVALLLAMMLGGALACFCKEPWEFFALHAFDHLDNLDKQAEPARLCEVSVLYATGVGVCQYMGLPEKEPWESIKADTKKYVHHAKSLGIPVVLGYLCSTSIVNLETFDRNWSEEFRSQFNTPPKDWLQQDEHGKPLPSWYGGDYNPACMNHPDWRKYQKYMVKMQLELGMDGIFFDNPTVHEKGCYCPCCMEGFLRYLKSEGIEVTDTSLENLRRLAKGKGEVFKKFRCTIARDFFAEIRNYAKSLHPQAIITANNSLNLPEVLFSQCHQYAYNIKEMSKAQDFVVIEDMRTAPRTTADGKVYEMGPVYSLLNAILGGKPLVAVTIADSDYHTPPNLTNLAIFEGFAHQTNYMLWPTWQEQYRDKMMQAVRPFVLWLQKHKGLFEQSQPRQDVLLYFPFEQWVHNKECKELDITRELRRRNIQFGVASEENFEEAFKNATIIIATHQDFTPSSQKNSILKLCEMHKKHFIEVKNTSFVKEVEKCLTTPSIKLQSDGSIRGILRDTPDGVILFLYNLGVEKVSSYEDKVFSVSSVSVSVRIPSYKVSKITLSIPDREQTIATYELDQLDPKYSYLKFLIPELPLSTILTVVF